MKPIVFGVIMTILVCAGLGYLWYSEKMPSSADTPSLSELLSTPPPPGELQDSATPEEPEADITPPPALTEQPSPITTNVPEMVAVPEELNQSDGATIDAARDIYAPLVQWMTPKEQLRKWVLLIDNVAAGEVPLKNRPFQFDISPFATVGSESQPVLAEKNFERLDPMISAFEKLDPELLGFYYRAWSPRLEQAYNELGQPGTFHERLLTAIDRVLMAEPLTEPDVKLKQPAVYYKYADREREAASELEKLLWRMGPANTVRIQEKLEAIRTALGTPELATDDATTAE